MSASELSAVRVAGAGVPSSPSSNESSSPFGSLPADSAIERTVRALELNGISPIVVPDAESALRVVLGLIPPGAEVFDATSRTLADSGIAARLQDAARFRPVRPRLMKLRSEGAQAEQRKLGAAPDYVVGSVHAVTERGEVLIASATGSQLGPYAFGAGKVIWVVGAQKIVPDLDHAFRRLREYTFPLEDARARQVYGTGSAVGKVLLVQRELQVGRITMVIVKEKLGF
ncbi:MAG TPA: LUD domain-containing protein [Thermoplasmata archaeon]|nr:LUD domain-containing protein [Thermoplasmata archaeon]